MALSGRSATPQREIEPPSTHQKGNSTVQKTPTVRAVVLSPKDEIFAKVRHYDPNRVILPQYVSQQSAMIVVMMGQNNMADLRQFHTGFVQSCAEQIPIVFVAGVDKDIMIAGLY
jgi:hypothetical protein